MRDIIRRYIVYPVVVLFLCLMPVCAESGEDSLELYARSAVLMDGDSGRILYGKDADTELPMASTTKIMTCILALEEKPVDTVCTVSGNAAAQPQVKLGMVKEDTFYLKDLLYSLMLESHNDTAVCIAENVSGSVEAFAGKMNQKARQIGCEHTHYITPNGLDGEDDAGIHHTTAKELALVMRYCLTQSPKTDEFLEITRAASYSFTNIKGSRSYSCTNHNTLLSIMEGALSGKTGFTGKAGYCYVGAVRRDGKLLIVSLLACGWPGHKGYKWADTKMLINYGLENFEKRPLTDHEWNTGPVAVRNGQQKSVDTLVQWPEAAPELLMREEEQIEIKTEMEPFLNAPVKKGQRVGTVRYLLDGAEYAACPVIAAETVGVRGFGYCLKEIIKMFIL